MRGGHLGGAATLGDPRVFSTVSSSMIRDLGCGAGGEKEAGGLCPAPPLPGSFPLLRRAASGSAAWTQRCLQGLPGPGPGRQTPSLISCPLFSRSFTGGKKKTSPAE